MLYHYPPKAAREYAEEMADGGWRDALDGAPGGGAALLRLQEAFQVQCETNPKP